MSKTLLKAIKDSGLSDRQLGKIANVDRLVIGRFKRGGHLRSDTIDNLCIALGLELRTIEDKPKKG